MEQFEVVLKTPEGKHYTLSSVENGEQILRVVPNSSEKSEDKAKFFTKITAEDREKVKIWLAKQKGKTDREKRFLKNVEEALKRVGTDYWIATLEPSVAAGRIYYSEGEEVGVGFSCEEWNQMAEEYAPERLSRLSNKFELFIWYALRIVNRLWTLDYVANNSSSAGNYVNAPGATRFMEKTGARECGGYCDGQGNTYKIVTCEGGYALVGGDSITMGNNYPVANVSCNFNSSYIRNYCSGVLVLLE